MYSMNEEPPMPSETTSQRLPLVRRVLRFFCRYSLGIIVVFSIVFFMVGRWSVYYTHPEFSGADQASAILAKVGAMMQLPTGENPTLATVRDAASAKATQPFLHNAENGDVLIVYPNAQLAIVYRPSTNKLIAIGPVDNGAGNQQVQQTQSQSVPTQSVVKNASTTQTKK